jgi:hypothetical protein
MPKEKKKSDHQKKRELDAEFEKLSRVLEQQPGTPSTEITSAKDLGYNYENLRRLGRAEERKRRSHGRAPNPYPLERHMSISRHTAETPEAQQNEVLQANRIRHLERLGQGKKGVLLPPPHRLRLSSDHPKKAPMSGSEADDKNFGGLGQHSVEALTDIVTRRTSGPEYHLNPEEPSKLTKGGIRKSKKSRKSRKKKRKRRRRTRRRR